MTDRDFKLLVSKYFDLIEHYEYYAGIDPDEYHKQEEKLREQIKKELARSTQQEIEELPFTTN